MGIAKLVAIGRFREVVLLAMAGVAGSSVLAEFAGGGKSRYRTGQPGKGRCWLMMVNAVKRGSIGRTSSAYARTSHLIASSFAVAAAANAGF